MLTQGIKYLKLLVAVQVVPGTATATARAVAEASLAGSSEPPTLLLTYNLAAPWQLWRNQTPCTSHYKQIFQICMLKHFTETPA